MNGCCCCCCCGCGCCNSFISCGLPVYYPKNRSFQCALFIVGLTWIFSDDVPAIYVYIEREGAQSRRWHIYRAAGWLYLLKLTLAYLVTQFDPRKQNPSQEPVPLHKHRMFGGSRLAQSVLWIGRLWNSGLVSFSTVTKRFFSSRQGRDGVWGDADSHTSCILALFHCRLTVRWLMSYIYGAPILDVSRSHTTTQHSR